MAEKKTVANLLRIVISLMYISLGLQGLINGEGSGALNSLFRAFDSDIVTYGLSAIIMISGLLLLVPLFAKGIPPVFVKSGMIALVVIWIAIIFFNDFAPGFNGFDARQLLSWIEIFMYHLIVLFATYEVCGKAISK
ncbi:hypothetical protein [uncultured Sphaerochaeta sp.]|uniref:hypothetical protein n=1 Tax=uncultured Sphaerochaeta sp. TaxID=886478 RepID=UPI002A0A6068|nr:hypothetical protein [uncultured Sphaerochaeta sp.]